MLADQKSQQLSDLVRKKAVIDVENEQLEETSRIKETQLPVLESELYKVESINRQLRSEHHSIREQKEKLVQELESLANEAAFHETSYITHEAHKQKFEEELNRLQNFIRDITRENEGQVQQLSQKCRQTEEIKASLNRILKERDEELTSLTRICAQLDLQVSEKESQIEVLEQKMSEVGDLLTRKQRQLAEASNRQETLQRDFENYQREIVETEAREFSSKLKADYIDRRW